MASQFDPQAASPQSQLQEYEQKYRLACEDIRQQEKCLSLRLNAGHPVHSTLHFLEEEVKAIDSSYPGLTQVLHKQQILRDDTERLESLKVATRQRLAAQVPATNRLHALYRQERDVLHGRLEEVEEQKETQAQLRQEMTQASDEYTQLLLQLTDLEECLQAKQSSSQAAAAQLQRETHRRTVLQKELQAVREALNKQEAALAQLHQEEQETQPVRPHSKKPLREYNQTGPSPLRQRLRPQWKQVEAKTEWPGAAWVLLVVGLLAVFLLLGIF